MDHPDSARMAYQRSLDADSADAAPHVRLSALAFATGDTAAALRELSSAARVQPQDAVIAYLNGSTLVRVGRDSGAVAELKRAEALDPWYAAPRILLALIYDAQGKNAEAIAEFRAFIGIASEKNALLPRARERLAALTMAPPAAAAPPAP
jgi:Flp pilus assembly protein TadD